MVLRSRARRSEAADAATARNNAFINEQNAYLATLPYGGVLDVSAFEDERYARGIWDTEAIALSKQDEAERRRPDRIITPDRFAQPVTPTFEDGVSNFITSSAFGPLRRPKRDQEDNDENRALESPGGFLARQGTETIDQWKERITPRYNELLNAEIDRVAKHYGQAGSFYADAFRNMALAGQAPISRSRIQGRRTASEPSRFAVGAYDYFKDNYDTFRQTSGLISGADGTRTVTPDQLARNRANTRLVESPNSDYLSQRRLQAPRARGTQVVGESLSDVMQRRQRARVRTNMTGTLLEGL